jgi:hypothetical protein
VKLLREEGPPLLSDRTPRGIKPQATTYKIADRDGMYVAVSPRGTITFRLDYRLNGRRDTLTIGRYGSKDGISLLMARERRMEARKAITEGQSPSQEKQRAKRRMSEAKTFDEFTKRWLEEARMADSTTSMRKCIIDRDIMPVFGNRLMAEIGPVDLRNLCAKVKARGAPATAVHVRDIVKQVFGFAALHGDKAPNPADESARHRSPPSWPRTARCRRPRSASCAGCWTPPRPCRPSAWRCA